MNGEYNDLIGDILKQSGKIQGKGKPLPKDYLEKDVFQNFQKVAKDAGFLPPWLQLQNEITELVHACQTEEDLERINAKIRKHNKICPPPMQKYPISFSNIEKAKNIW